VEEASEPVSVSSPQWGPGSFERAGEAEARGSPAGWWRAGPRRQRRGDLVAVVVVVVVVVAGAAAGLT
jgi:hypothetical protein